jgi:hypothetical protein
MAFPLLSFFARGSPCRLARALVLAAMFRQKPVIEK